jgi:hypothetical protein
MALRTEMGAQTSPKVYRADNLPGYWIAEGTDGTLYRVPSEPGGWLHGDRYFGQLDTLLPVPPQEARTIVWFTYGDTGNVKIAVG